MEKYIIEKFCLYEEEQILYECKGNIELTEVIEKESGKWTSNPLYISVSSGELFLTNYRIIAHGKLKVKGGRSINPFWFFAPQIVTDIFYDFTGGARRVQEREHIIDDSIHQELPCYGIQFPIKNRTGLSKSDLSLRLRYYLRIDNRKCVFNVTPHKSLKKGKAINMINDLFDLLRKNAKQVLALINEINKIKLEKKKQRAILLILRDLFESEEFQYFLDLDLLNIVIETYKLNPEFFINSIYPKMTSWKSPSFLSIKEELIRRLNEKGAQV